MNKLRAQYILNLTMNRPKKDLLIIASTFPRWKNDSLPTFVLDHAKSQAKFFDNTTVVAPHYKGSKTKDSIDGIRVRRFRYFFPASAENIAYEGTATSKIKKTPTYALKLLLYSFSQFISILKNGRHKIVNAHWLIPQGFLAVLARPFNRSKVVVSVHGGDVFALNGRIMIMIKRFTLKHADQVIVNSSATQSACKQLYGGRVYPIIPMGVDIDRFKQARQDHRKKRKFTVTFAGRLSSQKGVNDILSAAERIRDDGVEDIRFNIAGEGPEKTKFTEYVNENQLSGIISFLGWVQPDELPTLLKQSDIFIGPSVVTSDGWTEAFGLVFVEAAAAGLPVISTSTGGIKDIVDDNKTGFLVDQKSPDQLAEKIMLLKNNPELRTRMSKAALIKSNDFSWTKASKSYHEVLTNF